MIAAANEVEMSPRYEEALPNDDADPRRPLSSVPRTDPPPSDSRRARRLRARRVRIEELQLEGLAATARHATLGASDTRVEDLSLTGAALVIEGAGHRVGLVLPGDRLERLRIVCSDSVLYEGDALVRRVAERGNELVLGIELQSSTIDFSELYRLGTRHSFSERLDAALDLQDDVVSNEFKLWVNHQRTSLEKLKSFLDFEEHALDNLDLFTRQQTLKTYLEEIGPRVVEHMNAASRELTQFVAGLPEEHHPSYRKYYKAELHHLALHSPFVKRAYAKPLGYAGDYEMMNMLYRDHAEGDSLFAKAMNLYATQEIAAQANVNRLNYLGAKIRAAVEVRGHVRLASIGCGPARELGALLEQSPELGRYLDVALIDQEERVLVYCERTLSPLAVKTGVKLHFIRESVRRLLTAKKLKDTLGERDLIYSAGLFDYLNYRSFSALLGGLYDALGPSGQLCIGNVATHNPTRYFMEYALDWFLIHRNPAELAEFAGALQPAPIRFEVDAEPTGVNLFLRIWK
ncbi:MAG TPA: class I SAM-dependent methyltransferase [Polyangiaceae bacterium]|nr:class I SAM-dependent methyltransferase [Polyangiaceae bacterium]